MSYNQYRVACQNVRISSLVKGKRKFESIVYLSRSEWERNGKPTFAEYAGRGRK